MKTKLFLTMAIIASIGIVFIACGDNDDPADPPGYDNNKAPGAIVATPTLASKAQNSIVINAVPVPGNGQTVEYAISTSSAAPGSGWQNGLIFTGLNAGTAYYVFARSKANNAYNAGTPSAGLPVTTDSGSSSGGDTVTVTPKTAIVGKGHILKFNASVTGTNNSAQTVTWSVTGGGSGTSISPEGLLTVAINEIAATLTVRAVSTVDTSKSGTATVTVITPVSWVVHDMATWGEAVNGIRNGGSNKAHNINVSGNIAVLVTPASENTFGNVIGITVHIEGNGTISMSGGGTGSLLRVGAGQTVTVRNLTLQGRDGNNDSVVKTEGGTFRMAGNASVTGNTNSSSGGGVCVGGTFIDGVYVRGTFIMQDNASVTGNTSNTSNYSGGGVYVGGTFIMQNNTTVSGNNARSSNSSINSTTKGGGVYFEGETFTMKDNASVKDNTVSIDNSVISAYGGGVYIGSGTFTLDGGTISGNTASGGNYGNSEGGGVYVKGGTFNLKNGTISNNTARGNSYAHGGGVYSDVSEGGPFIMEGGTISNNTVIVIKVEANGARGGGVYTGNLIMKGGTISGNTISATRTSGSNIVYAQGGGVYVLIGTLSMDGGTISGNTITINSNNNTVYAQGGGVYGSLTKTGGTIYGNDAAVGFRNTIPIGSQGHAVYSSNNWRNATAGPTMNTASYGFWLNEE